MPILKEAARAMDAPAHRPLLTVNDLAKRRNCSVATVWRHAAAGLLPKPIRLGGLTRWDADEIEASIEAAKAARSTQPACNASTSMSGTDNQVGR